jgi:hypothetical protein
MTESTATALTSSVPENRSRSWVFKNEWMKRETVNGHIKLRCQKCMELLSYNNGATTPAIQHLRRHRIYESSGPFEMRGQLQMSLPASFSSMQHSIAPVSQSNFRDLLLDMNIDCQLPFTIVEKPSFQNLLNYANCTPSISQVKLPGADTMRRWLATKFTEMCLKIKEELHAQPWISYTTDVWTSPNMVPFMSITAHWIDEEWNKREVLIAFEEIRGIHTGGFSIHYSKL